MRNQILFFLLSLFLPLAGIAQLGIGEYSFLNIPPELINDHTAEVVREEQILFEVKSEEEGVLNVKRIITVLNAKSDENEIVVGYDADSKIKNFKVWLYDGVGKEVRKIGKDEFKDQAIIDGFSIYRDDRIRYVDVAYSSYPYTIVYEYEKKVGGVPFCMLRDWYIQTYGKAVEKGTFSIIVPQHIGLHYKALNTEIEPRIEKQGEANQYTWTVSNLPAPVHESYGPGPAQVLPRIMTALSEFKVEDYQGSMSSWGAYGTFMYDLYQGKDVLPSALKAKVHEIVKDANTNIEKVDLLYRFMQAEMRYVSVQLGIGGWQPFDAEYVYTNKYGDCKALSNFMKAMLKEVGIEAYPTLIERGGIPSFQVSEDFAKPAFNHVILYIPSEDYWLECTSNYLPPNYLGSDNLDRNVMLITPEGGKIVRTPKFDHTRNLEKRHTTISIEPTGSATVEEKLIFSGKDHERYRWIVNEYSREEQEAFFYETSKLPGNTLNSLTIIADTDEPNAQMEYSTQVKRYASKAGKRLFVPLNQVNPRVGIPEKSARRTQPIVRRYGYTEQSTTLFKFPDGFQLESFPEENVSVESVFGTYKTSIKVEGETIIFNRFLKVYACEEPAESYSAFRTFFKDVAKSDGLKLVLVKKRT